MMQKNTKVTTQLFKLRIYLFILSLCTLTILQEGKPIEGANFYSDLHPIDWWGSVTPILGKLLKSNLFAWKFFYFCVLFLLILAFKSLLENGYFQILNNKIYATLVLFLICQFFLANGRDGLAFAFILISTSLLTNTKNGKHNYIQIGRAHV